MKWLARILGGFLIDLYREWKREKDYQEAVQENARRDAEARELRGVVATKERMDNVPKPESDLDALRRRMHDRRTDTP